MKKVVLLVCAVLSLAFLIIPAAKSETGTVGVTVLSPYWINITSPLNTTYTGDSGSTMELQLNVTSNFTADAWWYKLIRVNNDEVINSSVFFSPNTTVIAVSGINNLTVYANDSYNRVFADEVIFSVDLPNSNPIIKDLNSEIFFCEDIQPSSLFNVTDPDGDDVTISLNQTDFFVIIPTGAAVPPVNAEVFSVNRLTKEQVGSHKRTVEATDTHGNAASQDVTITVIEINHAPVISPIPTQTIYLNNTQNNTFYYEVQVSDIDHGNQTSGNFSFNITFLNGNHLFNISKFGVMNFTPNSSHIGNYNISINVTDIGLTDPHAQILTECGQTGLNMSSNITFQLTISNQSTPPYFTSYYPTNLVFTESGTANINFNISKKDNETTIPDAYWYVDNVFKELDQLSTVDTFSYNFGCGVSGLHTVRVEITDGIFNTSLQWNITITEVACPTPSSSGGGGGGGGAIAVKEDCEEKWGCYNWENCQNAERTFLIGLLEEADYNQIKLQCKRENWNEETCGFQIRQCFDVNNCGTVLNKPSQIQHCYFTENPSCDDGIKNCHDGSCELLVDCGGPSL